MAKLSSYYPILFVLFFIFMLGVTAYRLWKAGNSKQKTDIPEIDKYMHPKCGVSEDEILDVLKSEDIDYRGVE